MSTQQHLPPALRGDNWSARVLRDFVWKPAVLENDWAVFVMVGRENSGKSLSCASILKAVDPAFSVDRAHFNPVPFLKDIAYAPERPGVAVMGDEFGVGFGKRTWHDREQIEANQALQTARDDNRIIGVTVPRLEELDSQLEGRMHLLLEAVKKKPGEYVECKFKVVDPSRDGAGKVYKKYPKYHLGSDEFHPETIRVSVPPQDFIDAYEAKKAEFKGGLYDRVIDQYEEEFGENGEPAEDLSPKQVVEIIKDDGGVEQYVFTANNGRDYVEDELIRADYELSKADTKTVKKLIEREIGLLEGST